MGRTKWQKSRWQQPWHRHFSLAHQNQPRRQKKIATLNKQWSISSPSPSSSFFESFASVIHDFFYEINVDAVLEIITSFKQNIKKHLNHTNKVMSCSQEMTNHEKMRGHNTLTSSLQCESLWNQAQNESLQKDQSREHIHTYTRTWHTLNHDYYCCCCYLFPASIVAVIFSSSNKHLSINNTWAWDETSFSKINIKCYSSALSLSQYISISILASMCMNLLDLCSH